MADEQAPATPAQDEQWRKYLLEGHAGGRWLRRVFRLTPASPRCNSCLAPFAGIGGRVLGVTGFAPSRKNPRFCRLCCEWQPLGGVEIDIGVLFADMRGYTSLAEQRAPEDVARMVNRLYAIANDVLVMHGGAIDKMMGDEVMALFFPGLAGGGYITKMVSAAETMLERVGRASNRDVPLPIGIGLDRGLAFVGNLGSREVTDFTAVGDVVNTAARLQGEAKAGQIVMSERVYEEVGDRYPNAQAVELQLKGKSRLVAARIVEIG